MREARSGIFILVPSKLIKDPSDKDQDAVFQHIQVSIQQLQTVHYYRPYDLRDHYGFPHVPKAAR